MKSIIKLLLCLVSLVFVLSVCIGCNNTNYGNNNSSHQNNNSDNIPDIETNSQNKKQYCVTLDYNDGSGRQENVYVPEGEYIYSYVPYPIDGKKEVVAWSQINAENNYEVPVTNNITLYAQWKTFETVVYTNEMPSQINDRFSEIHINQNDQYFLSEKVLRIGADVRSISIVSNGTTYTNFAIMINSRSSDLNITMDNFSFRSNKDFALKAADSSAKYTVNLNIQNTVYMDSLGYIPSFSQGGANCVEISNLNIFGTGTLCLVAGRGADGESKPKAGDGKDGENGGSATNGGVGILSKTINASDIHLIVIGGNGGNGGNGGTGNNGSGLSGAKFKDGGNGGKGGNGGDAIKTETFVTKNTTLELIGGDGGYGGNGGDSGGSSAAFAGNGGNGGNGGKGGYVFGTTLSQYSESGALNSFTPGEGGKGGNGGDSEDTSIRGKAGINGSDGIINAK